MKPMCTYVSIAAFLFAAGSSLAWADQAQDCAASNAILLGFQKSVDKLNLLVQAEGQLNSKNVDACPQTKPNAPLTACQILENSRHKEVLSGYQRQAQAFAAAFRIGLDPLCADDPAMKKLGDDIDRLAAGTPLVSAPAQ